MATKKAGSFHVNVAIQGQTPKIVEVGASATLRKALEAAGQNPEALGGAVTLTRRGNVESADLSTRLQKGDYIAVTPKAAGGSR